MHLSISFLCFFFFFYPSLGEFIVLIRKGVSVMVLVLSEVHSKKKPIDLLRLVCHTPNHSYLALRGGPHPQLTLTHRALVALPVITGHQYLLGYESKTTSVPSLRQVSPFSTKIALFASAVVSLGLAGFPDKSIHFTGFPFTRLQMDSIVRLRSLSFSHGQASIWEWK